MKNLTYLLIATLILILFSCKKSGMPTFTGIYGPWKINAYFLSSGGAPSWTKAPASDKGYVTFNQSGTLETNLYTDFSKFTIKDSVTLVFAGATVYENYRYILSHDTLTLTPTGPLICVEGCAAKFTR